MERKRQRRRMSVADKRQTLRHLIGDSSGTQRGLVTILRKLTVCPAILEECGTTEKAIRVALFEQFDRVSTKLDLDLYNGKTVSVELCNPNALLQGVGFVVTVFGQVVHARRHEIRSRTKETLVTHNWA